MGKTVTTYLIDGDPKGTQYVFISNKICQMYVIPRSNLAILNERQELQTPAFYILLGEDEKVESFWHWKTCAGQFESCHSPTHSVPQGSHTLSGICAARAIMLHGS